MQTKLFVFFSILAFCHMYGGEASPIGVDLVIGAAQNATGQIEQTLKSVIGAVQEQVKPMIEQMLDYTAKNIMASFTNNTEFNPTLKMEEILQASQILNNTFQLAIQNGLVPNLKAIVGNVTHMEETAVNMAAKVPEAMSSAVQGAIDTVLPHAPTQVQPPAPPAPSK